MGSNKRQRQKAGRSIRRGADRREQQQRRQRRRVRLAVVSVGVLVTVGTIGGLVMALLGNGSNAGRADSASPSTTSSTPATAATSRTFGYGTSPCPAADGSSPRTVLFAHPPARCISAGVRYSATFETTAGTIVVDLDTTRTPGTANNFVFLARWHYYDGTKLFRVAKSIDIIQGGAAHTNDGTDPGPGYFLPDEGNFSQLPGGQVDGPYRYHPGDLAMARAANPDGSFRANSAAAQFFFVAGLNGAKLDGAGTYVVFGHVAKGLDVLEKIERSATEPASNGSQGDTTPDPPVTVTKATISPS